MPVLTASVYHDAGNGGSVSRKISTLGVPPTRPKVVLKRSDEIIHKLNLLTEKYEKRLTFGNLRLSARFLSGELRIVIHFRPKDSLKEWVCGLLPEVSVDPSTFNEIVRSHPDKMAMFIDIVRIMQVPKRRISAFVWFESVDSFYSRLPRSLYFSTLKSLVLRGLLDDGETNTTPDFFAKR